MDEWTRTLTTGSKPQSLPSTSGTTGVHVCIKESDSKRRQEDTDWLKLKGVVLSLSSRMNVNPQKVNSYSLLQGMKVTLHLALETAHTESSWTQGHYLTPSMGCPLNFQLLMKTCQQTITDISWFPKTEILRDFKYRKTPLISFATSFALDQLTRNFFPNAKALSTPQQVTHHEWIKQVFAVSFTADLHPHLCDTHHKHVVRGEAASTGHNLSRSLPGIPWLIAWTGCFSCGCQTWIQTPAWSLTLAGILCSHCCCDPTFPGNNKQIPLVKGNSVPHIPKLEQESSTSRPLMPTPTKPCPWPASWLWGFLWVL